MLRSALKQTTSLTQSNIQTTSRRYFGARTFHRAPESPFVYPRIDPLEKNPPRNITKKVAATKPLPNNAHKKYFIIALNGGGRHKRQHSTPHFLGQLPHDSERFSGRVIQHKPSYGYIIADKTKETIFYHIKSIDLKGFIKFLPGQRVTFELTKYNGQTVANVVRPMVQKFNPKIEIDLQTGAIIKPQVAQV